ncbi:MAG: N-acetylglucosamine-6-phosphate deacetylase [Lentisphaeria bacterium]|nr:N-acetylglucosamine-6-phosphate deacetylase [Lentisphaerota bacterium]MBR2626215.1 N-acetylglucosamine-6-phosphate deacetylase [Lentisphaeria bacterium]
MKKSRVRRLYLADYLITPDHIIPNGGVLCENDKIIAVGGMSGFSMDKELELFQFDNAYLTPGFIDTHIHGAGGFDCSRVLDSRNDLSAMSSILGERGATGFFPTVVSDTPDAMIANLRALVAAMKEPLPGADAVGINIEGPFLNPEKSGAQPRTSLREIDLKFAADLIDAGENMVKVMTFAPELANADKLIELLVSRNVIASMGHSLAGEKETLRAIDAGANHCTHLFNGMNPLHQRNVGLPGIVLTDDRVTVELIIDGRHVHSRMVDLACRCKTLRQIIGISDGTMASGMPDGAYHIGPSEIIVKDGFSQTSAGKLAGTTTMLDAGWHSLMSCGHLSETKAAQAVTRNPAEHFNLSDRGQLLPGLRADLAIFERGTNRPLLTVRRGEIISKSLD